MNNYKTQRIHEIIGRKLESVRGLDLGTFYPVVNSERIITGVFSAEFGSPENYRLDKKLQAFVPKDPHDSYDIEVPYLDVNGHEAND